MPIFVNKAFWGFLGVDCFEFSKSWSASEKNLLKSIAGILATVFEKREAKEDLYETEQKFRSVLENVPAGVFWKGADLRYQGCNRHFAEFMGAPDDEIFGMTDFEVMDNKCLADRVRAEDMRLLQEGGSIEDEYRLESGNGATRWVRVNKLLVRGDRGQNQAPYILGALSDITERRVAEEKTRDALAKVQSIVDHHPGMIWGVDANSIFTLFEGLGLRAVGIEPGAFVGLNAKMIFTGELSQFAEYMQKTFETGAEVFTAEIAGRFYHCSTTCLIDADGNITGQIGVSNDITEITMMQRKLEAAIEAAENASRAKSDFLSRMSHEIRTPMNAIIGMNAIAAKSNDLVKVRYCLDKIEGASKQLLGIINDILDMSKIEANKFEIESYEFNFEKMLLNVCNVISVKIEEKKQNFVIDMEKTLLRTAIGDELRLTQVMINLLTNASKFTPENGKIILKIAFADVTNDRSRLRVEVRDNGIGISAEQKSRLFTSFEQADGGITRRFGGTGLGLAICKKIVELMGGKIWVESREGEGSSFIFEVDLRWGGEEPRLLPVAKTATSAARILAVDDSEDVRIYFEEMMKSFHMRCDVAASGEEAIAMVRDAADAGDPYTIVFVDWQMPGIDGVETTRRIKSQGGRHIVVIMISVAKWSEIDDAATKAGVDQFLPKPLLPSVLLNTILTSIGAPPPKGAPGDVETAYDWQNRRILLAEDVEINREILHSILEDTRVTIDDAENGRIACDMFAADPERYDVILIDIQMPVMDGYQATEAIRAHAHPRAAGVPIIAMTANAFKEDINRCLSVGMNDHVAKPIDIDDLMGKLAGYLQDDKMA